MTAVGADRCTHALSYLARGWAILPLRGKRPYSSRPGAVRAWIARHPMSPELARSWFGLVGAAEIGILVGEPSGGLAVVDIEGHAVDEIRRRYPMPRTPTATTPSGGVHVYCVAAPGTPNRVLRLDGRHVGELRAAAPWYVAAPPAPGRRWIVSPDEAELVAVPEWVWELVARTQIGRHTRGARAGDPAIAPTPISDADTPVAPIAPDAPEWARPADLLDALPPALAVAATHGWAEGGAWSSRSELVHAVAVAALAAGATPRQVVDLLWRLRDAQARATESGDPARHLAREVDAAAEALLAEIDEAVPAVVERVLWAPGRLEGGARTRMRIDLRLVDGRAVEWTVAAVTRDGRPGGDWLAAARAIEPGVPPERRHERHWGRRWRGVPVRVALDARGGVRRLWPARLCRPISHAGVTHDATSTPHL